jgi:ParB family chromosome partitioning protein
MVTINEAAYSRIDADEVAADVPYPLSWGTDIAGLKASIEKVGQVSPMVLWPWEDRLNLLCGVRRRRALRELGVRQYHALVLPEGVEPREALVLAVEENLGHRSFNDAEIVLAVNALTRFLPPREVLPYLPRLGLPPTRRFLDRFNALADLGPEGLDALAEGFLDPESGELLSAMNIADRNAALDLLDRLRPGQNKRREILSRLTEIARREECPVSDVIQAEEMQDILQAEKLNRPQKEKRVREYLRARRLPGLIRLENERTRLLKALNLPPHVRLIPPPDFEGLAFHLDIDFPDLKTLEAGVSVLERLLDDPRLASLVELG